MQVVYKIAILDECESNVPSTTGRYTTGYGTYAPDCVDRPRAIHKCRPATHQWISFITANVEKYSMCWSTVTITIYNV